jgi:hypothetical protein
MQEVTAMQEVMFVVVVAVVVVVVVLAKVCPATLSFSHVGT